MRIRKIKGYPIWQIHFPDQYTLTMTFLRIQEYQESPSTRFRGKIFTLEEYMDWYARVRGDFTYTEDWAGFNVPSSAVEKVYRYFPAHSEKKKKLFSALAKKGILHHEPYCLIGTFGDDLSYLNHEICHGMFICDREYRRRVTEAVRKFRLRGLRRWLLDIGYFRGVLVDEINAYVTTGFPELKITKEIRALRRELKKIARSFTIPR